MEERVVIKYATDVSELREARREFDTLSDSEKELKREAEKAGRSLKKQADDILKQSVKERKSIKQLDDDYKKLKAARDASTNLNDIKKYNQALEHTHEKIKKIDQAGLKTQKSGGILKNLGGVSGLVALGGGIALTSQIAQVGKEIINTSRTFEAEMSRVKAITQATGSEYRKLEEDARRLGKSTEYTATEVASLQVEYAKLGFSTKEILNATEATLQLAKASGEDLASSAMVAGSTVRGFGMEASETQKVVDVMASSFTKSALDLESFRESIKLVAPISKAANISLEMTTAMLGKLADAGLKGSIAGTSLKNLLSKLSDENSDLSKQLGFTVKNSEDLQRAFDKLAKENIDLTKATELTDERSKAAFLTMIEGTDSVRKLAEQLGNASGSAKKMSDTMADNLDGDIKKLNSALEGLYLTIMENNGALRNLVQNLTDMTTAVDDFVSKVQDPYKEFREGGEKLGQQIAEQFDDFVKLRFEILKYEKSISGLTDNINSLQAESEGLNYNITSEAFQLREVMKAIDQSNKKRSVQMSVLEALKMRYEELTDAVENNSSAEGGNTQEELGLLQRLNNELQAEIANRKTLKSESGIEASNIRIELIKEEIKALLELGLAREKAVKMLAVQHSKRKEYQQDFDKAIKKSSDEYIKQVDEQIRARARQLEANEEYLARLREQQEEEKQARQELFYTIVDFVNQLASLQQQKLQQRIDHIQANYEQEMYMAGSNAEAKARIEADHAREMSALRVKQAQAEKRAAMFNAIINTALGVSKALASAPPPINFITAALVGAAGAVQIANIASSKTPAYAKGVIDLMGEGTGTSDSINAKLARGESVMTAKETKEYKPTLLAIRRNKISPDKLNRYTEEVQGRGRYRQPMLVKQQQAGKRKIERPVVNVKTTEVHVTERKLKRFIRNGTSRSEMLNNLYNE